MHFLSLLLVTSISAHPYLGEKLLYDLGGRFLLVRSYSHNYWDEFTVSQKLGAARLLNTPGVSRVSHLHPGQTHLTPLPSTARLHSPGTPAALHLWQRPFSFSLGCLFPNSWTLNSCVITTGVCSVFLLPWFIDRHTHNSPCRKVIFWWSTPRKQEAPQISPPGNSPSQCCLTARAGSCWQSSCFIFPSGIVVLKLN